MAYTGASEEQQEPQRNSELQERGAKAMKASERAFRRQSEFLPLWQAQAEIFYPERADFTTTYAAADERYDGVHSSLPSIMRRDMANNLGAMIRPRGKDWFKATASPISVMKDDEARIWCGDATATQRNIVYDPRAMFTRVMNESDNDYVTFGASVVSHSYRSDQSGLQFSCMHLRDCAWSQNADGMVDTLHNKMKLTLRQIVQLLGQGSPEILPREWRMDWDKGHTEEIKTICRTVTPIEPGTHGKKERVPQMAKYCSIYMADGIKGDATLAEYYFLAFPFTVREWMSVSGENYARSPCTSVALADARTLNSVEEALLTSVEQAVRPAKYAKKGVILSDLDLRANTVTFISDDYDSKGMGAPIANIDAGDPRYAMDLSERMAERIGTAFYQNVLKLPDHSDMTAYEVAERIEIYTREAAPIFEPMEAENAHIMDSIFTRAMAKGAFGKVRPDGMIEGLPEVLQGKEIRFEFETPLSDALRKQKANQFDGLIQTVSGMIATQHPAVISAIDQFDMDAAARDGAEGKIPPSWIRKLDDVAAKRQADAEAADAAKKEAQAMEVGQSALGANPENLRMAAKAMKGEEVV